jgi:hypothetical protein
MMNFFRACENTAEGEYQAPCGAEGLSCVPNNYIPISEVELGGSVGSDGWGGQSLKRALVKRGKIRNMHLDQNPKSTMM